MGYNEAAPSSWLARVLSVVTAVEASEAKRALLLALNFFFLLAAYYTMKPIREGLILSMDHGAEVKSYTGTIQTFLFVLLIPAYAALTKRFSGRGILILVYLFMASNLLIFIALGLAGFSYLGIAFFLWIGMFSLLTISQTWSLCTDTYTPEQGKRLFPLIALGSASGAAFGSLVVTILIKEIGLFWPMAISALLLVICSLISWFSTPVTSPAAKCIQATDGSHWKQLSGGLGLIFSNRYLMLVALLVLIANLVNTTSEYMLGRLVAEHVKTQVATGLSGGASVDVLISAFYGQFFLFVNVAVFFMQLLAVSRIIRHFGTKMALMALPVLALINYLLILILPILSIIRVVKIIENSTDYSLNNTVREILFLPVAREAKYKAKLAIDTCFWRGGDALSALPVAIMSGILSLGIGAFAGFNIVLVLIWIFIVQRISARRRAMSVEAD